jgi:hypothetical protein
MPALLLGLALLLLLIWGLYGFTRIDPRTLAPVLRKAGGLAAIGGAVFLGLRGQIGLALPLGIAGLSLLGWLPGAASLTKRMNKSAGQVSRVRAPFIEMELDHDSGAMRGRVLAGRLEGVTLEALDLPALLSLLPEIDEESRGLLLAYLDRREPTWREHADAGATTGSARVDPGKMTEEEAYQILGVQPGASAAEIGRAHRALMKKLHPDQGGSTYLAARVNEAKDLLLKRHR